MSFSAFLTESVAGGESGRTDRLRPLIEAYTINRKTEGAFGAPGPFLPPVEKANISPPPHHFATARPELQGEVLDKDKEAANRGGPFHF